MAINIQVTLGMAVSVCSLNNVRVQLAIIASATVHVIAHGGMSYALLFASAFVVLCAAFDVACLICSFSLVFVIVTIHESVQVMALPPSCWLSTVYKRPRSFKLLGSCPGCTCLSAVFTTTACVTGVCRYVLHRHDEAALMSLVWQGNASSHALSFLQLP
jgi:hypothetical protein